MIKQKHLVLDLETLATDSRAFIVSAGWAIVEPRLGVMDSGKFIVNRNTQGNRRIDPNTVAWWLQQSPEAIAASFPDRHDGSPYILLDTFHKLWAEHDCSYAWGFSSMFDLGITESLARQVGHSVPWNHKNALCLRTLSRLMPHVERPMPDVPHDPESDARAQGEYLCKLLMASAGSL